MINMTCGTLCGRDLGGKGRPCEETGSSCDEIFVAGQKSDKTGENEKTNGW